MSAPIPQTISEPDAFHVRTEGGKPLGFIVFLFLTAAVALFIALIHWYDFLKFINQGEVSPTLGTCFLVIWGVLLLMGFISRVQEQQDKDEIFAFNIWLAENYGLVSKKMFREEMKNDEIAEFTDNNGNVVMKKVIYKPYMKTVCVNLLKAKFKKVPYMKVTLEDTEEVLPQ